MLFDTDALTDALAELAATLPGEVLVQTDPSWAQAAAPWTLSVDQRPLAVVTVADDEDVVATVRWAARHGLSVSAQPVGHGATTALDGTILIRTRALDEITIDAERRIARVGAGVKWGELSPPPSRSRSPRWPAAAPTPRSSGSRSEVDSAGSAAPTVWPVTA